MIFIRPVTFKKIITRILNNTLEIPSNGKLLRDIMHILYSQTSLSQVYCNITNYLTMTVGSTSDSEFLKISHTLSMSSQASSVVPIMSILRHWGQEEIDAFLQMIFSNAFSWMKENAWISIKISQKFVPKVQINNIPALVQIMAWHRPGDKPLSEPMMVILLMDICVTRPQWVKENLPCYI